MLGGAFEAIANVLPFTHALGPPEPSWPTARADVAIDLAWVVGYTGTTVALAIVLFRRQMTP